MLIFNQISKPLNPSRSHDQLSLIESQWKCHWRYESMIMSPPSICEYLGRKKLLLLLCDSLVALCAHNKTIKDSHKSCSMRKTKYVGNSFRSEYIHAALNENVLSGVIIEWCFYPMRLQRKTLLETLLLHNSYIAQHLLVYTCRLRVWLTTSTIISMWHCDDIIGCAFFISEIK